MSEEKGLNVLLSSLPMGDGPVVDEAFTVIVETTQRECNYW